MLVSEKTPRKGRGDDILNSAKLEYEMKIRNVSIDELCEGIGMSRSAFYRKRCGHSEFTQSEIQAIVNFLHLASPMGIFFDEKVS